MKETNTVIGGEGNGGVIYPESHYGRDALVGVGLFLSHFVAEGKSMTALKATYPQYFISKNKLTLSPDMDVDKILEGLKKKYASEEITDIDGVKIDFKDGWVHLRKSNTEPIIRIYSESKDEGGTKPVLKIRRCAKTHLLAHKVHKVEPSVLKIHKVKYYIIYWLSIRSSIIL